MLQRTFTPFPVLPTERLILRQLTLDDANEMLALRSDAEINKYLNRPISKTIEDARGFINKVNENIAMDISLYWAIVLAESSRLVGTICMFGFSEENSKCEIGYELLTKYQGQGIMKEAVKKVIDYAFNIIQVKKMEAWLHRDNKPSLKLLEKLLFKKSNETDSTNPDLICYYLTNADDSG